MRVKEIQEITFRCIQEENARLFASTENKSAQDLLDMW